MEKRTREWLKTAILLLCFGLLFAAAALLYRHFSADIPSQQQLPQLQGSKLPKATAESRGAEGQNAGQSQQAPELVLTNNKGETVALSSLRGRIVFLNFWASNCTHCRHEFPDIQAFYDAHHQDEDFYFYSVHMTGSWDSKEAADTYMQNQSFTMPYFYDPEGLAMRHYQAYSLPTTALVGPDGSLQAYRIGAVSRADLEEALKKARAQFPRT